MIAQKVIIIDMRHQMAINRQDRIKAFPFPVDNITKGLDKINLVIIKLIYCLVELPQRFPVKSRPPRIQIFILRISNKPDPEDRILSGIFY